MSEMITMIGVPTGFATIIGILFWQIRQKRGKDVCDIKHEGIRDETIRSTLKSDRVDANLTDIKIALKEIHMKIEFLAKKNGYSER